MPVMISSNARLSLVVGCWMLFLCLLVPFRSADAACEKPNLLYILDKSGSMNNNSKWANAKAGVVNNAKTYENRIRFGLETFSTNASIDAGIPSSSTAISAALNKITPLGDTYMVRAMNTAKAHLEKVLKADSIKGRPTYIVFITDGSPSDRCPTTEVTALRKLNINGTLHDVKTYVIGFGVNVNPTCLNSLATAGGTALAGTIKYYFATNQSGISTVISQISNTASQEVCNGLDDDCDGKIDNIKGTTKALDKKCSLGKCAGTSVCQSGKWSTCKPVVAPSAEVCNNKDDDCDGYIDNIKGNNKNGGLTQSCTTACGKGTQTCNAGRWSSCSTAPKNEVCDGKDNDCDGKTDNIKGTSNPVYKNCSVGRCSGRSLCVNGRYEACKPTATPSAEVCNNKDDDCDGYIDNIKGVRRNGGLTQSCSTACGTGVQTCYGGRWGSCSNSPRNEVCNGKDDDCDGKTDNIKGTSNPLKKNCTAGRCSGQQLCQNGRYGTCTPLKVTAEVCNNKDDDCDGYIDNAKGNRRSYTLKQACKSACGTGTETCISGRWRNCTVAPKGEVCDGKDNDCDGRVDNQKGSSSSIYRTCYAGRCRGKQYCTSGKWATCKPDASGAEVCNNKDDDCDGKIDNAPGQTNYTLKRPCTSACGTGTETCIGGRWRNCTTASKAEVCDGKDNDCDGKIDNVKGSSTAITQNCRVGRCNGKQTCSSGKWQTCKPSAAPTAEICNNKDDNCDGYIDNASGQRRSYTLKQTCKTACGTGTEVCLGGRWRNCTVAPKTEICDGKDNDCDGKVDNVKGASSPISRKCSVGRCSGQQQCQAGKWATCQTTTAPAAEICNNQDDDCDGWIDNAKGQNKHYSMTQTCTTACGKGTEVCIAGRWRNCSATPKTEICNGKDDDCDGKIDENWTFYLNQPCKGACTTGKYRCQANGRGVYCDAPPKGPEICDGLDNDCDGKIDENFTQKFKICFAGSGACQKTGVFICRKDKKGLECSVKAPDKPSKEICDGIDNNCDGKTDENLTRPCTTPCGTGTERCSEGTWSKCSGSSAPKTEICNNKDDDCDGVVDKITRACTTSCGKGTETCVAGKWSSCSARSPGKEVCDGQDNDCNGIIDDNLQRECSTACGKGKETCVQGRWVFCSAKKPKKEDCNGKDDDCNGSVDDGLGAKQCQGGCGQGQAICLNGKWSGCSGPQPKPEVCNNKDDDCNGKVDDNLERKCTTTCGEGTQVCKAGDWTPCSAPQAGKEVCDGKDNNCDGKIDEKVDCPKGYSCLVGACRPYCRNGECPAKMRCIDGKCVGSEPCIGVKCPDGYFCNNDKCVDLCASKQCPDKQICKEGKCYEDNCYAKGCKSGERCVNGKCELDPCDGVTCQKGEYCKDGSCVGACLKGCKPGEKCVDGKCEKDPCATLQCRSDEVCVEGKCVLDKCGNVTCPAGKRCVEGQCEHDPCFNIQCPEGTTCQNGTCVGKPPPPPQEKTDEIPPVPDAGPNDGTEPGSLENTNADKVVGDKGKGGNKDGDGAPVGDCGCNSVSSGLFDFSMTLLFFFFLFGFVGRLRRQLPL
jgi:hypothetical protein